MTSQLIEQIAMERNISEKSKRNYYCAVKEYEHYTNKTLNELLKEAEAEEDAGIRWKHRQLKTYLTGFRAELSKNYSQNTMRSYFTVIKTIYNHYEIEIHKLPSYKTKQLQTTKEITFDDLITKKELLEAYEHGDNLVQALILFMSSSGVSRTDTCNISIQQFISACKEYITTNTLEEQLLELSQQEVIPTFHLQRQKTKKNFYTFCSPEATQKIINYLHSRDTLSLEDKLFDIHPITINRKFQKINDMLELGEAGSYRKFVPHMLRKYQASVLTNCKHHLTEEEVDVIQGRSKNTVHRAYFKNDPKVLKEKYIKCIKDLSIISGDKFTVNEMLAENSMLKNKIDEQDSKLNTVLANQKRLEVLLNK